MKIRQLLVIAAFAALTAGCASTSFESTWSAPGVGPEEISGVKVVGIVMAEHSARLSAEDAIATKLGEYAAEAKPSYPFVSLEDSKDELQRKLKAEGFQAAIVMRVLKEDKELRSTNTGMNYGMGYPGDFYGGGWGWGMYSAPEIRTDTLVFVETLVYDLDNEELIWAGRSKTTNPSNIDKFVGEILDKAIKEMRKSGLLAAK